MRNYRPRCLEGQIGVYGASSSPMGRLARAIQEYGFNRSHEDRNDRQSNELQRKVGGADIFLDHSGSTYIIPKLSLYSTGLMPPKVILIRSSLYQ